MQTGGEKSDKMRLAFGSDRRESWMSSRDGRDESLLRVQDLRSLVRPQPTVVGPFFLPGIKRADQLKMRVCRRQAVKKMEGRETCRSHGVRQVQTLCAKAESKLQS